MSSSTTTFVATGAQPQVVHHPDSGAVVVGMGTASASLYVGLHDPADAMALADAFRTAANLLAPRTEPLEPAADADTHTGPYPVQDHDL